MSNRLAASKSLYLRKHAENPIDWWYWCDEALETARRENKPIFLSGRLFQLSLVYGDGRGSIFRCHHCRLHEC
ncbi:DUF255 domain-containing protein [Kovacikia minuta]|uniref:DUF255 domain-containing protein n=1 Tax=Kovacikia minuta TaxID=2931930 RepID=UPI0036F3066D